MQSWSSEMWQAAAIGLVLGIVLGYLLLRFTKDSVKKQLKTETELKDLKQQVASQQQELEQHFAQSATLLKTLAQDYQKFYQHLAQASTKLLPETPLQFNAIALEQAEKPQEEASTAEALTAQKDGQPTDKNKENPPKDYSEGSSGILKTEAKSS